MNEVENSAGGFVEFSPGLKALEESDLPGDARWKKDVSMPPPSASSVPLHTDPPPTFQVSDETPGVGKGKAVGSGSGVGVLFPNAQQAKETLVRESVAPAGTVAPRTSGRNTHAKSQAVQPMIGSNGGIAAGRKRRRGEEVAGARGGGRGGKN